MPDKKHIHVNGDGLEFYNDEGNRNVLNPNPANTSDYYNTMPINGGALIATANAPTNGQTLQYDSGTDSWRSVSVSGGGIGFTTIVKSSNQLVVNDSEWYDDLELYFTMDAGATYLVNAFTATDATGGSSFSVRILAPADSVGATSGASVSAGVLTFGDLGGTRKSITQVMSIVSATGGTFKVQYGNGDSASRNSLASSSIAYLKMT